LRSLDDHARDRAFRDHFAHLVERAESPATTEPFPDLDLTDLNGRLSDVGYDALTEHVDLLRDAWTWRAYRRSSLDAALAIHDVLEGVRHETRWLTRECREKIIADLDEAALTLRVDVARADELFLRLGRVRRAVDLIDGLEMSAETRKVREAVMEVILYPGADESGASLRVFERAARMAGELSTNTDDQRVILQLRPAWRTMRADAVVSERQLIGALASMLESAGAVNDPAVLSAFNAHQRNLDDLRAIHALSLFLADPGAVGRDPRVRPERRAIAARLLDLLEDLDDVNRRDLVLGQLRTFASNVARFHEIPGEAELEEAIRTAQVAPWMTRTGRRHQDLLAGIRADRTAWLDAWGEGNAALASRHARRLALEHDVMSILLDAILLDRLVDDDGVVGGALQTTSTFEIGSAGLAFLTEGLDEDLQRTVGLVLGDDLDRAEAEIDRMNEIFAAARRLARTEREAATRSIPDDTPRFLRECCLDEREDWLADDAAILASIARYAEDGAASLADGQRARAEAILTWLNTR
ncbi:MAG: hypothetical protein KDA28_15615, partial [Phycisphaerales bacterium]|nr:hypothetical protein [Phycisphaerales bacterium]